MFGGDSRYFIWPGHTEKNHDNIISGSRTAARLLSDLLREQLNNTTGSIFLQTLEVA